MAQSGSKQPVAEAQVKRRTRGKKAAVEPAATSGAVTMTPLDYMLSVVRDESASATARMNAAKSAAPYVHVKAEGVEPKPGPERIGEALLELIRRAQAEGEGVAGLVQE
jgi:hypothetical protein